MLALLTLSIAFNVVLLYWSGNVQRGSFGILGPCAGVVFLKTLQVLRVPVAVISLDIRKVHEWILVMGYEATTKFIHSFLKMRYGKSDYIFQYGGDEFVIVVLLPHAGAAEQIIERMIANMDALTKTVTREQRARLHELTGGVVDGLSASIAYVAHTNAAYNAAKAAMDVANNQKAGQVTGSRATSGKAGTIVGQARL